MMMMMKTQYTVRYDCL